MTKTSVQFVISCTESISIGNEQLKNQRNRNINNINDNKQTQDTEHRKCNKKANFTKIK